MIEDLQSHYKNLFIQHGDSAEAVQYASRESQERRFKFLVEVGDLNGKSILDFGCGTGQLYAYLQTQGVTVSYHGVEIVDEFIELCQSKYPSQSFGKIDAFEGKNFDYVFVSGVFNNLIKNNREFYQSTLKKLFGMTRIGLSFNMMSAYVDYQDPGLFYEYPENVFSFLKKEITPYVSLRNDYEVKTGVIPFDFTVYAYRGGK
jgi:cyclopropane fatty-acyl-phospholipid synthase-like methyltransferase